MYNMCSQVLIGKHELLILLYTCSCSLCLGYNGFLSLFVTVKNLVCLTRILGCK